MPPRNFTDEEEVEIGKIYLAGYSTKAIARAYKLPGKDSILGALRRQNIKQRSPAERNRLYQIDAHAFDVIDTEEKAYWWGFIYADGNVYKRSLSISLKRSDREHLVKLKSFLKSEHPIRDIMVGCSNGKEYKQSIFYATDRHLANRLCQLGIVVRREKFTQSIIHLPESLERHWIRGLMDGDGSIKTGIDKRGASIGICGYQKMLKWIRKVMADNVGTNPNLSIRKHKTANIYYLNFSGNVVAHSVSNWLYDNATIWMTRKKKRVDNWPLPLEDPYLRNRDEKGRFN